MKLVEVVILVGSQCLSPIEAGHGVTEAAKVHCAVLIRQDPETEVVEILPRSAATDPRVIAMLVQPIRGTALAGPDAPMPAPQPATSEGSGTLSGKKMQARNPAMAVVTGKKTPGARRSDSCGSYKAVWYTNKYGRRKYRCVRAG